MHARRKRQVLVASCRLNIVDDIVATQYTIHFLLISLLFLCVQKNCSSPQILACMLCPSFRIHFCQNFNVSNLGQYEYDSTYLSPDSCVGCGVVQKCNFVMSCYPFLFYLEKIIAKSVSSIYYLCQKSQQQLQLAIQNDDELD